MIHPVLHQSAVALDRDRHRDLKLVRERTDFSPMATLNASFVNAVEFVDACREYAIVFVDAGKTDDGRREVAPMAVFGLTQQENLYLDGSRWVADYVPAQLRMHPFGLAPTGENQYAILVPQEHPALSRTEGTALFEADGEPSAFLLEVQQALEVLQAELQRTRAFCARLVALDLLRDMRFEATLPDGNKLAVDGFLMVDDKKLAELPDEQVLELHRSGALALVHAHLLSMGHMRRLVARRLARSANA